MSKPDLGSSDERDWGRLKEGRNRGAGRADIPLLYLPGHHIPVASAHSTPVPPAGYTEKTKLDSAGLHFSQTKIYAFG